MNIIIGHSNTDLDCFGSMVLARYLYPGYRLVRSSHIHPVAQNLYTLYQNHLDLLGVTDLKDQEIEKVVIVDTRCERRVREVFGAITGFSGTIEIYDHHPADSCGIEGAVIHDASVGANTTLLGMRLMDQGISIGSEDATIALAGVFADTGSFTHENTSQHDFRVAAYLAEQGASLELVKTFLQTLKGEHQITALHDVLNRIVYRDISGHLVITCLLEMQEQVGGLAAVAEKVFDIEAPDGLFLVFSFTKQHSVLVVARSGRDAMAVNRLLEPLGGGGHPQAASAVIKKRTGQEVHDELLAHLQTHIAPAPAAHTLMSEEVDVIRHTWSLLDASLFLESIGHTGAPVVDREKKLVGFMTLRDIMKARRVHQMHAPVTAYMTRNVVFAHPETTVREVESLLLTNNIGHLPVVDGDGAVAGIVTRSDYLRFIEQTEDHRS